MNPRRLKQYQRRDEHPSSSDRRKDVVPNDITVRHAASRLTVGVICKNGMPYLKRCLQSLPPLAEVAPAVDFIMVDAGSTDGSRRALLGFANARCNARVYFMNGEVNAAATRNVVLANAAPGPVFLVDCDVAVNAEFVMQGLREIAAGSADAVYGRLPEVWHDARHQPYARNPDRYKVRRREYVDTFKGVVLLGPAVTATGMRYDERLRRLEDPDFSLRVRDSGFRILALPLRLGTHYTMNYYSAARLGDYYRDAYQRPAGQLLRKNLRHPCRLWWGRRTCSGNLVGLGCQGLVLAGVATGAWPVAAGALALGGLDAMRFALQGRIRQYIPIRIVGGWQVVAGFVRPEPLAVKYDVKQAYPQPALRSSAA